MDVLCVRECKGVMFWRIPHVQTLCDEQSCKRMEMRIEVGYMHIYIGRVGVTTR